MSQPSHNKVNHDIEYLKQDQIGLVISKGLAVLYQEKPRNPVDYLAKWLLNYASIEKKAAELAEAKHKREDLRERHASKQNAQEKERAQQEKEIQEHYSKLFKFEKILEQSDDLTEHLSGFANILKEFNNATGAYIGKLKHVTKSIDEGDFDGAHIDKSVAKVITYIAATPDHEYIIGKTLPNDKGVTYDIFKEKEVIEEGGASEPSGAEGTESKNAEIKEEILKSVYIPEVVREPRMKYFRVPKLGSYYAVLMTYECCQFSEALDTAFEGHLKYQERKEEQEKAKKVKEDEWEKEKQEKEKDGLPYEQEDIKWEEISEPEYKTKPKVLIVCLDTMGQDREFNEEEKKFVMQWAKKFRDRWEESERQNLFNDVLKRVRDYRADKDYSETEELKFKDEEEKAVEAALIGKEEIDDEEGKAFEFLFARFKFYQKIIEEQTTMNQILSFKQLKVIKFQRIFQSVFYLLGYKREEICRPNTNKLFWKKAKQLLNDSFIKRLGQYNPIGPKEHEFNKYQLNSFISQNIEGIQVEDVYEYSVALGRLFKWLGYAISLRKEDVSRRRAHKDDLREKRRAALAENEDISNRRNAYLIDERQKYDTLNANAAANNEGGDELEIEPFNEEQVLAAFDHDNPKVEIIEEVVDDIDNDIE